VEVLDVEEFLLSRLEPAGSRRRLALGAMPIAARVVNRLLVTAVVTLFEMTSQGCRPALCEILQYSALLLLRAVALAVRRTVFPDDIGHFRPMFRHFVVGFFWLSFRRSAISR
jgi:hypothetical protein